MARTSSATGKRRLVTLRQSRPGFRSTMVRRAGVLGQRYRYRRPSAGRQFTPEAWSYRTVRRSASYRTSLSTADSGGSDTHVMRQFSRPWTIGESCKGCGCLREGPRACHPAWNEIQLFPRFVRTVGAALAERDCSGSARLSAGAIVQAFGCDQRCPRI